jgi:signal transduction histidine kinase
LNKKNKELESFSFIASHDLQEPIRKIRIWTSRIDETADISDGVKNLLQSIQKACIRMQDLILGVLQYSQIDMLLIPRELTDLDQVLDEVLNDFSDAIEEKQIRIERDHLPTLYLVRLQFVQLFSNILSNAIKFSRKGQAPCIKITCILEREVGQLPEDRTYYVIKIADNGIGFKQEHAEKMFEMFRRLESSHGYTGTGIGLAICKKIVQNHQGTISASGESGHGAAFTIRLPVE